MTALPDIRPRERSGARRPLWLALACLLVLALTGAIALLLPGAYARDAAALHGFTALNGPRVGSLANRVVHLGDAAPVALLSAALALVALVRGRPRLALAVVVMLGAAVATSEILKPLLAVPRHVDGTHISAASWPSGHSTAAMALALGAIMVAPRRLRPLVALGGMLYAVAVAFSLLTLAWHFPSDVVGGYLVAGTWACLTVAALRAADARWAQRSGRAAVRRAGERVHAGHVGAVASALALALAVALVLHGHADFALDHRALVATAAAIAGLAAALAAGFTAALRR